MRCNEVQREETADSIAQFIGLCSKVPGFIGFPQTTGTITLNQRVQGSSPCAPTNKVNDLAQVRVGQSAHILQRSFTVLFAFRAS